MQTDVEAEKMRLISTSEDKTMMYVECDGTELTIGGSIRVDREKLTEILRALNSKTVKISKYLMRPEVGNTELKPMETLLIEAEDHKGFILAPIE